MPELPEVETVRRDLQQHLLGCSIKETMIRNGVCIKHPAVGDFVKNIQGKNFIRIDRRGKYLRLILEDESILSVHLRMTGRLIYTTADCPEREHTHIIFKMSDGAELRYSDTRRFGCLWWQDKSEPDCTGAAALGLEPLDEDFSAGYLMEKLSKSNIPIKTAILNQKNVAGLGNIYADEVLFVSGISPLRTAKSISAEEWETLAQNMRKVLLDAIENRGTTFSDFLDGEGHIGSNQQFLRVYGRKGKPCSECGKTLEYIKVGGRGTVYCPVCQK